MLSVNMTIAEAVKKIISDERAAGHTLQQIADKFHIPQPHVANLLNHRRTFEGITLGTFAKMFPRAEEFLDGPSEGITQNGHHNAATANGDAIIQAAPPPPSAPDAEALRSRITAALIRADLPADALKTALTVVQDTR